jgi:transposase
MPLDCTPIAPIWAGLDISKEHVDYFVLNRKENPRGRLPRRASALGRLARSWRRLGVTHAVIEATGGFEREVWESLEKAGIAVTLIQPRRVRQFAGACAIEAKTDRIDAELLARFGAAIEPAATPLPGPAMSRYRELLRQLNYLVGERARLRTRTHRVRDALVRRSLARVIKSLSTEIEKLEQAVRQALEALPEAARLAKRLQQAGGVGKKTAWALTAELPELGRLTGKQAASLAGLAPRARDSGTYSGKRSIGAGRPALRRALYLAALSAVRTDQRLRDFYQRLQAAGKPKQLGLIAVARRLLVMLNAMARDGSNWRPAPLA